MRCTQIMGLPPKAILFLTENQKQEVCPTSGAVKKIEKEYDSARAYGMFDDGPDLYEYTLKDGSIVKEVLQEVAWSSGPCIFLKLVDENNKTLFSWSKKDIENA